MDAPHPFSPAVWGGNALPCLEDILASGSTDRRTLRNSLQAAPGREQVAEDAAAGGSGAGGTSAERCGQGAVCAGTENCQYLGLWALWASAPGNPTGCPLGFARAASPLRPWCVEGMGTRRTVGRGGTRCWRCRRRELGMEEDSLKASFFLSSYPRVPPSHGASSGAALRGGKPAWEGWSCCWGIGLCATRQSKAR